MTIETRIINALQSVLDKRPLITSESRLEEDLRVDSLEKLMIVSALEDEFSISITDDSFTDVATVGDIAQKLKARGLLGED